LAEGLPVVAVDLSAFSEMSTEPRMRTEYDHFLMTFAGKSVFDILERDLPNFV
jgi:hypothetical protein